MSVRSRYLPLAVCLLALAPFGAASAAVPRVNDEAKLFSPQAVEKANARIAEINRDFKKDLLIETIAKVPPNLEEKLKQQGKNKFFADWARERALASGVKGIYVLICKSPGHLEILVDRATQKRDFTLAERDGLVKKLVGLLGSHKYDEALQETVSTVYSTLAANMGRPQAERGRVVPGSAARSTHGPASHSGGGISPLGWVLIAVAVVVGLWLLIGFLRMLGGGGAGGGMGGMGGGMGGGGGGGFMSGLMGGLFGAVAGNWLYNNFFGGGHGGWGSEAYGGEPGRGSDDAGAGDFSSDPGGGGDFDAESDTGGGDFGGGDTGGDFGGGDFGGGDFGGGDFGGGDGGGGDF